MFLNGDYINPMSNAGFLLGMNVATYSTKLIDMTFHPTGLGIEKVRDHSIVMSGASWPHLIDLLTYAML